MERKVINIVGEINENQLLSVIEQIREIRASIEEDLQYVKMHNEKAQEEHKIAPEPVIVNISSAGGTIIFGNAIIDELKTLNVPIITRCLGFAGSMAYIIFLSGDYRIMGENSALMYHGASNMLKGTLESIENNLTFDRLLEKLSDETILRETFIKKSELDFYKERSKNWFMNKEEALKNGSATHDLSLEKMIEFTKKDWITPVDQKITYDIFAGDKYLGTIEE